MKKTVSTDFAFTVIIFCAVIVASIALLYSSGIPGKDDGGSPAQTVAQKKHSVSGNTATAQGSSVPSGWKTFENEKFLFRVSCPQDYKPGILSENTFYVGEDGKGTSKGEKILTITVSEPEKSGDVSVDPEAYAKELRKEGVSFSETTVGGKRAFKNSADGTYVVFVDYGPKWFFRYDIAPSQGLGEKVFSTLTFPKLN